MTLRVTIEIVPFGEEDKKYPIRQLDIFNKGQYDFGHYEYGVIELNPEKEEWGLYSKTVLHRRDLGAPALIAKVIKELDIL